LSGSGRCGAQAPASLSTVRRALLIAQALDQNWVFWDGAQVQVVPARTVSVPAEWIPGESPDDLRHNDAGPT